MSSRRSKLRPVSCGVSLEISAMWRSPLRMITRLTFDFLSRSMKRWRSAGMFCHFSKRCSEEIIWMLETMMRRSAGFWSSASSHAHCSAPRMVAFGAVTGKYSMRLPTLRMSSGLRW